MQRIAIVDLGQQAFDITPTDLNHGIFPIAWSKSIEITTFHLHVIQSGSMTLTYGGYTLSFGPGDLSVMFPLDRMTIAVAADTRLLHCRFGLGRHPFRIVDADSDEWQAAQDSARSGPTAETSVVLPDRWTLTPADEADDLLKQLSDMRAGEPAAALIKRADLFRVLGLISQSVLRSFPSTVTAPRSRAGRLVRHAMRFIEANLAKPISVREVAASVSVDPNHLGRVFKQSLGKSVGETILLLRMEKARNLLKRTDRPIGDIAKSVGYPDSLYFSRLFRREMGLAPSEWRQNVFDRP
ncbi:MAG: helix-turn-helix transcriptional regulator [Planctomycetes bacterium]|nr:helix-turn-helix transcriptional regulator [Planctomycetota bacterium]